MRENHVTSKIEWWRLIGSFIVIISFFFSWGYWDGIKTFINTENISGFQSQDLFKNFFMALPLLCHLIFIMLYFKFKNISKIKVISRIILILPMIFWTIMSLYTIEKWFWYFCIRDLQLAHIGTLIGGFLSIITLFIKSQISESLDTNDTDVSIKSTFCSNCGYKKVDDTEFCPECGEKT